MSTSLFIIPTARAQSEPIDLDQIMTDTDQRATGVNKLSEKEREALAEWLVDFATHIYKRSTASADAAGSSGKVYPGVGDGHWIAKNIESGRYIRLEDGSLWEINAVDRALTSIWLPISSITVLEARNPVGAYTYVLINTDDGEEALAKYVAAN